MLICSNILKRQQDILCYKKHFHRGLNSIAILAVSKKRSVEEIREAIQSGQKLFGESYLQEAIPKIEALGSEDIEWHFIGPIQSNKAKDIAKYFDWVHSVDRIKIVERLQQARSAQKPALNVCIEVNICGEESKSGAKPDELIMLAQKIVASPNLKLRGLMAIPEPSEDFDVRRANFHRVKELYDDLNQQGFNLDTLSMGMSDDFIAAIAEGATIVRLGTAIFGKKVSDIT